MKYSTKKQIFKTKKMTEKEILEYFKINQNKIDSLESMYKDLIKNQKYALAKLYSSQIDVLKYLQMFNRQ